MKKISNQKGFTLVSVIIGAGLIAGLFLIMVTLNENSKDSETKIKNKVSKSLLYQLIISRVAYEDVCKSALHLPNSIMSSWVTTAKGDLSLSLLDGTIIKAGESINKFDVKINSLTVENIAKIQSSYGYSFYSGEILISSTMTKNAIKGSTTTKKESLGPLQFLINSAGEVISCAGVENLQESAAYLAAKSAGH